MSDYNNLVNASILTPTASTDLGSDSNRYNNIFLNGNIAMNGTTITADNAVVPRIVSIGYNGDDTAASPAGGQSTIVNGSGFVSGAGVYINGIVVSVVTVVSSSVITFSSPAKPTGNYSLIVVNPDGASATFGPGIQYSGVPAWSTSAGTLASAYEADAISNSLTATSDSTVTYSVTSGTLPTGVTLNTASGSISGTAPVVESSITYNFTVNAKDGENQDTDRNFSYTINPDSVTWSTPASGATLSGIVGTAYTQALSATSAAGRSITYTANALPTGLSISGASITGTPSATSSITSLITATAATTGRSATRTVVWSVVAPIVGQTAYTTPGTYSWTAPAGVTSVGVVAIGGGGGYSQITSSITPYSGNGGGGGGLGWKNNIAVTPGQSYTVVVGAAGDAGTPSAVSNGTAGGSSYFINASTVAGYGGGAGTASIGIGGSYVGDGGGSGGNSGTRSTSMAGSPSGLAGGAGGGAGGYAGAGGTGGAANPSGNGSAGTDGAGGGGGGGGGVGAQNFPDGRFGGAAAGAGGGTGILGQGTNGAGGVGGIAGVYNGGWANSSGNGGTGGSGTGYGGGAKAGSACGTYGGGSNGYGATGGAVRIIWGTGRSFPSTLTTDQ